MKNQENPPEPALVAATAALVIDVLTVADVFVTTTFCVPEPRFPIGVATVMETELGAIDSPAWDAVDVPLSVTEAGVTVAPVYVTVSD